MTILDYQLCDPISEREKLFYYINLGYQVFGSPVSHKGQLLQAIIKLDLTYEEHLRSAARAMIDEVTKNEEEK